MFPQGRCERCMVRFELCGALAATASSRDSRAPLAETGDRLSFSIRYITEEVFQLNSLKTNRQNKTQKKNIFSKQLKNYQRDWKTLRDREELWFYAYYKTNRWISVISRNLTRLPTESENVNRPVQKGDWSNRLTRLLNH